MENIECGDCGNRVLGLTFGDPKPVGRDDCPHCGATEFERMGGGSEGDSATED